MGLAPRAEARRQLKASAASVIPTGPLTKAVTIRALPMRLWSVARAATPSTTSTRSIAWSAIGRSRICVTNRSLDHARRADQRDGTPRWDHTAGGAMPCHTPSLGLCGRRA